MFWSLRMTSETAGDVDLELELGRTTVVVGSNGSGKSTVVEALAHAGWGCPDAAEALAERGKPLDAIALLSTGDAPPLCAAEANLVHIAREGQLRFAPTAPDQILAHLRAATVGLSPAVTALQQTAERLAAAPELEILRGRIAALVAQRAGLPAALATRAEQRARIDALTGQAADADRELAALDAEIERAHGALGEQQSLGRGDALRSEAQRRLEVLAEQRADFEALARLAPFSREALGELDALLADKRDHEERITALEGRRAESRGRHDAVVAEQATANEREPILRRAAARATVMKQRLERVFAEPHTLEHRQWQRGPLTAGGALAGAGIASVLFGAGAAGPAVGLVLGAAVAVLGRRTVRQVDTAAVSRSLAALAAEWNTDRDAAPMVVGAPAEAIAFLDAQVQAYEQLRTHSESRAGAKRRLEQELAEILDHSYDMLERTLPNREQAVGEWLGARGCQSREEYAEKVGERDTLETRIAQRAAAKVAPKEPEELQRLEASLHQRIETLTRRMGPRRVLPAVELRGHEAELQAKRDRRAALQSAGRAARGEIELLRGKVTAAGGLWTELHRTELALAAANAELASLEHEAEAARRASDLVRELEADPHVPLAVFAHAAGRYLSAAGVDGTVEATSLAEAGLSFGAAGQAPRPLRHAGSGTRDLVVLAARLALSEYLVPPGSILVLEEPFVHQDRSRITGALRMLRQFQDRTSSQLVLVSRDRSLVDAARQVFRGPKIVDLDQRDAGVQPASRAAGEQPASRAA